MTDEAKALVAWLREEADFAHYRAEEDMLTEAADTIEALAAQLAEARAENARLRGRLAHAEDDCEDDCIYCEERRQEIARAKENSRGTD